MEEGVVFWERLKRSVIVTAWYVVVMMLLSRGMKILVEQLSMNDLVRDGIAIISGVLAISGGLWLLRQLDIPLFDSSWSLKTLGSILVLTIGMLCIVITYVQFLQLLGTGTVTTQNEIELNDKMSQIPFVLSAVTIAFVGPIYEEIIFRGLIIHYICRRYSTVGLVVSTIIFATLHLSTDIWQWSIYGVMGLYLGIVYLRTRNLYLVIGIHILNNLIAVLNFYAQ